MQFPDLVTGPTDKKPMVIGRRTFLGVLGLTAGAALLPACKNDDEEQTGPAIAMGADDEGLMRYAYSLEMFMTLVTRLAATGRAQIADEKQNFETLHYFHEAYRELFKAQLNGNVPANLEFDTTKIAFTDKARVHNNLILFSDLVSSAYMDMAGRFTDPAKKQLAAKIASACARQSTRLRWTRNNLWPDRAGTDANSQGLEIFEPKSPQEVTAQLNVFFITKLDVSQIS